MTIAMFKAFIHRVFPPRNLWSAARRGDVEAIRRFVSGGADVNAKRRTLSASGFTPLHYAAGAAQMEALKELVRLGARVDEREDQGGTPLLHAVGVGADKQVIDVLLGLGANINKADRLGMTPLEAAAL